MKQTPLRRGQAALTQVTGAATTRFAYDGVDSLAEYDGSGALQRRYVFDPTTGQPVVQYEGAAVTAGNRRYLSQDERGSVISATTSTGTLIGINTYDEYGIPGAANIGRFQYTGQAWIPELALYYYKARMYSPKLGRFAQPDPIGYADSPNLYNYVLGDPVNLVDPLGLEGSAEVIYSSQPSCASHPAWCVEALIIRAARLDSLNLVDLSPRGSVVRGNESGGGGGWGHDYPLFARLTGPNSHCSPSQVAYALNFYAIPGADGPKTSGQSYSVHPTLTLGRGYEANINVNIGTVQFISSSGGRSVSNVTYSDHLLHNGRVNMTIFGSSKTGYSISGRGFGTNSNRLLAGANQLAGPSIFDQQFDKMRKMLESCD